MAREANAGRRRRRRLTIVGLLGAVLAFFVVLGNVPPPRLSHGRYVAVERGRLPKLWPAVYPSQGERRLSHVASVLAGRGVLVYCWSKTDWERRQAELARRERRKPYGPWSAYTSLDRLSIHLSPGICTGLAKLQSRDAPAWRDPYPDALAWSVGALAHEAQHAAGVFDEAEAECRGVQTIAAAAHLLGRTDEEGRFLAETYWEHWYRWAKPRYTSSECRNGGRLDLRPETDVWP